MFGDDRVTCHAGADVSPGENAMHSDGVGHTMGDFSLCFIFMHFVINFMILFSIMNV